MTNDASQATDEVKIDKATNPYEVERKPYVVAAESGIFKNGKLYAKGETIELDAKTAKNFAAAGDLEESDNE